MSDDLISRSALKKKIEEVQYTQEFCIEHHIDYSVSMQMLGMVIDNAQPVDIKPFALLSFNKDELEQIVRDRVIEPIKNGELVIKTEERPKGEWIKGREISRTMMGDEVLHIEYKDYTCSNCGLVLDNLLYHLDGSPFYKFCPNCGADMRVKPDEEKENL